MDVEEDVVDVDIDVDDVIRRTGDWRSHWWEGRRKGSTGAKPRTGESKKCSRNLSFLLSFGMCRSELSKPCWFGILL